MALTRIIPVAVVLAVAPLASAQEPITLADATSRALAKNHAVRVERARLIRRGRRLAS